MVPEREEDPYTLRWFVVVGPLGQGTLLTRPDTPRSSDDEEVRPRGEGVRCVPLVLKGSERRLHQDGYPGRIHGSWSKELTPW